MKAIEIKNLSYWYADGTQALRDISINIPIGQRVALLGVNGSGKTTLLYHLNGLLLPQEGSVEIMGRPVKKENLRAIRQKVGMLFDNPDNQLVSTTVHDDVAFGPRNLDLSNKIVQEKATLAMEKVEVSHLADKSPCNLSLGQKKRVAIAGVLAMDPELLVFDEPLAGLDPQGSTAVVKILDDLYKEGKTIILTTHDVDMVYSWADIVLIINEGRLMAYGSASILEDFQLMKEASLDVPLLVKVFQGTGFNPRNAQEANQIFHQRSFYSKIAR